MEKIKLLFDMTEHPERHNDAEWNEMLGEQTITDAEVEAAWERFRKEKLCPSIHRNNVRVLRKIAASVAILMVVAGISIAAVMKWNLFRSNIKTETSAIETISDNKAIETMKSTTSFPDTITGKHLFENVKLDVILSEISRHYAVTPIYYNKVVGELRLYYEWNSNNTLESVINELNLFEHVNIEQHADSIIVK